MSEGRVAEFSIRRMCADDLKAILHETPEAALWQHIPAESFELLAKGDSVTGLYGTRIVGCGGIVLQWPGLAEAWLAITPLARLYPIHTFRWTKRFVEHYTRYRQLRRLQIHVNAEYPLALKFATTLGFHYEASLKNYGPNGETFYLMARVN